MKEDEVPDGTKILSGRFVLTLKLFLTPKNMDKVQYIVQGFDDALKKMRAHDVTVLRPTFILLLHFTTALLALRPFSHDKAQVYLEASYMLPCIVHLRAKPDRHLFSVAEVELFKLRKRLYDLCSSGYYWKLGI